MLKFKLVDHIAARKNGATYLQNDILPLLAEHWEQTGHGVYNADLSFNLEQFSALWLTGGMTVIIAYENDKPVGLLIGIKFRPMLFNRQVLMVETCYCHTDEIEDALYKYVTDLLPVMSIDEVWVQGDVNRMPRLPGAMRKIRETAVWHFERT